MKFRRCIVIVLTVVLAVAFFSVVIGKTNEYILVSSASQISKTVILDAGHPELVGHYRISDLPPNMQFTKNRTTVRFFGVLCQNLSQIK